MTLRQERINKFLVQEISAIVSKLRDPRLSFATFTEAAVAPDLHTARVGVSFLGGEAERQESLKAIQGAAGHIRRELMRAARRMKTVPYLEFYLDEGALHSTRVQELLKELEDEQSESTDT